MGKKNYKKAELQRQRKLAIMAWLKPYLETRADNEAEQIWTQLKIHGEAKEWKKFAHIIRRKWLNTGHGNEEITCLDNGQHCLNMWDLLKDISSDTTTEGSGAGIGGETTEQSSLNTTALNETGNVSSSNDVHTGGTCHTGKRKSNELGEPKDQRPKKKQKQRQRKDILMAWLKPYMDTKPDDDAHRIWDELGMYAEAKNWPQFGNVIRRKWLKTHMGDVEPTTCLDNSMHCRNIWDLLTGTAVTAGGHSNGPY